MHEDDGAQGNESVNDAIFSEIASANHELYASRGQLDKAANDPAATGKTGGGTPTKEKKTAEPEEEGDNRDGLDTQDFSRRPVPSVEQPEEEAAVEPEKVETPTTNPDLEFDWKSGLPEDPGELKLEAPTPDEDGRIDPIAFAEYLESRADYKSKVNEYNSKLITATFDAVERILPEVKDNKTYQAVIRNAFNATNSPDETVNTAKSLRAEIDRIAGENKMIGSNNAKTSIEIQANATVEAKGASSTPKPKPKTDELTKRLAKGETSAAEELMEDWLKQGKV